MARIFLGVFVLATRFALAADGDPDPAFGSGGQLTIERPPGIPTAPTPTGDVAALADGRFLWIMANEDGSVWVGRAAHDGTADAGFGSDGSGHATVSACSAFSTTRLLANEDGGAVIWSGACLLRLTADGSVDAGFGGPPRTDLYVAGLARDRAGRYVLAGVAGQMWKVFRFTSDGVLDETFANGGEATIDVPATNSLRELDALAVRDDGRIVVGGWRGNTHGPNLVIAQLTADGTPDPEWNGNGLVDLDPPAGQDGIQATALALAADGTLVVGGVARSSLSDCCLLLTRFDAAGAIVADFGMRLYDFDINIGSFFEGRDSVALRADGTILLATTAFPFSNGHRTQFVLMRTDANGLVDPAFGDGGWRGYTIEDPTGAGQGGDYDELHAVAFDGSSALLFGRTFFEDNSNGLDYVSMVRAVFDRVFADGFD